MTVFPMNRIKRWAELTGRAIGKTDDGKFYLSRNGVRLEPVARPRFRRNCSKLMMKEGYY